MDPSGSKYQDQGVQGCPMDCQSSKETEREEEHGRDIEDDFSRGKRRGSPIHGAYTGSGRKDKERSLASYGSWEIGSQALKISGFQLERLFGDYDMDDSSFFAHTTRLNIIGPTFSSTRSLRRRSSSTERIFINSGERPMATTANSSPKSDRSRSPSPAVAPIPEKRTSPTESYVQISLQSSLPLADPTASRKLLVLDLNGTLLLRSAHSGRRAPPPSYSRVRHSADSHPSSTRPYPALRTIYARPYLPSFCAFIFHPTTLQWLDTMVWSSAQPHSVNDMVDKCFGAYKERLKAVWARDTLGLSSDEYYKKTQTTKDLAKPWAQIPSLIPNPQPLSTSHPPDHENPSLEIEADRDSYFSIPQHHSALTTILMDDSPLKAILQPWNHLCVSEYGSERRKLDVEIVEREMERMWLAERERAKEIAKEEKMMRDAAAIKVDMAIKSSETDVEAERKRKRKEKKMLKKEKLLLAKEQQAEAQENEERGKVEEESYDELLLAVIGILDGLKHEGNVAGWVRSGGLVHVGNQDTVLESHAPDGNATTSAPTSETPEAERAVRTPMTIPMPNAQTTFTSTSPPTPSTKRDSSAISPQGPCKRRRLNHSSGNEMDPVSITPGRRALELELHSEMAVLSATPTQRTTKRTSSMSVPSTPLHSSPPLPSSPLHSPSLFSSAQTEEASTGVPLSAMEVPCTPSTGGETSISTPTLIQPQLQPLLWFETPSVLSHWAQRGRKALAELGIEIVPGVVPSNQNGNGNAGGG